MEGGHEHSCLALTGSGHGHARTPRRPLEGKATVLIAAASPGPKGGHPAPPAGQSSLRAVPSPAASRPDVRFKPPTLQCLAIHGTGGEARPTSGQEGIPPGTQRCCRHACERETIPQFSPRSKRSTASRLRWRDMRPEKPSAAEHELEVCALSTRPLSSIAIISHWRPPWWIGLIVRCLVRLWWGHPGTPGLTSSPGAATAPWDHRPAQIRQSPAPRRRQRAQTGPWRP